MFDDKPKKCPYCLTRVPVGVTTCPGCRREMLNLWKRRYSSTDAADAPAPQAEESARVLTLYYQVPAGERVRALALLREMAGNPAS